MGNGIARQIENRQSVKFTAAVLKESKLPGEVIYALVRRGARNQDSATALKYAADVLKICEERGSGPRLAASFIEQNAPLSKVDWMVVKLGKQPQRAQRNWDHTVTEFSAK